MTLAVIEFNDQSLLIQAEDETRYAEPGFARLTDQGIETGDEARKKAWLEPMHMYNQYWCHLNQTPLAQPHRFARHHGDIAFAQLRRLWEQAGRPDELVLLTPGSFTRAQLSLLLGLVGALPAKATAILDSALAACMDVETDTMFIDMHLHETVVSVCGPRDGSVRLLDEEIFPGVGMSQLYNSVARHISNALIDSYRFDPLHASATEQVIYDQLPHWLTRLGWEKEISITLESEKGELPCILSREKIKLLVQERLTSLYPFMDEWPDCNVVLAHNGGVLAGLVDEFSAARVARRTAGTRRVLENRAEIFGQLGEVHRVRSLVRQKLGEVAEKLNGTPLATHILYGENAFPLSSPVSIELEGGALKLGNHVNPEATLTVVRRNHQLETLQGPDDIDVPMSCLPGEKITIGGQELRLIRVAED